MAKKQQAPRTVKGYVAEPIFRVRLFDGKDVVLERRVAAESAEQAIALVRQAKESSTPLKG